MNAIAQRSQAGFLLVAGFIAIIWAVNYASNPSMPIVNQVKPYEVFSLIQAGRTLVLDVREKEAYDKGHLPGAISVPVGELDSRMEEFEAHKAEEVVVYCNDGSTRGPRATEKMNKAGFAGARNLEGGVEGWRKASYQTITK